MVRSDSRTDLFLSATFISSLEIRKTSDGRYGDTNEEKEKSRRKGEENKKTKSWRHRKREVRGENNSGEGLRPLRALLMYDTLLVPTFYDECLFERCGEEKRRLATIGCVAKGGRWELKGDVIDQKGVIHYWETKIWCTRPARMLG